MNEKLNMRKPHRKSVVGLAKRNERGHVIWSAALDRLLGHVPDIVIADMLGCNQITVQRRRRRLNIAAYRPEQNWTPKMDEMIILPTNVVAALFGVSARAVRNRRHRLGVHVRSQSAPDGDNEAF